MRFLSLSPVSLEDPVDPSDRPEATVQCDWVPITDDLKSAPCSNPRGGARECQVLSHRLSRCASAGHTEVDKEGLLPCMVFAQSSGAESKKGGRDAFVLRGVAPAFQHVDEDLGLANTFAALFTEAPHRPGALVPRAKPGSHSPLPLPFPWHRDVSWSQRRALLFVFTTETEQGTDRPSISPLPFAAAAFVASHLYASVSVRSSCKEFAVSSLERFFDGWSNRAAASRGLSVRERARVAIHVPMMDPLVGKRGEEGGTPPASARKRGTKRAGDDGLDAPDERNTHGTTNAREARDQNKLFFPPRCRRELVRDFMGEWKDFERVVLRVEDEMAERAAEGWDVPSGDEGSEVDTDDTEHESNSEDSDDFDSDVDREDDALELVDTDEDSDDEEGTGDEEDEDEEDDEDEGDDGGDTGSDGDEDTDLGSDGELEDLIDA